MQKNPGGMVFKLALGGFELLFVGVLCYMRVMDMGWMLLIFGLLLLPWVLVHLVLLTALISSFKLGLIDIGLYLAVHLFYLAAWLFQSDGGDSGGAVWVIQQIYDGPGMGAFLQKWGDNLFYVALTATLVVYLLIGILLVIRLVRYTRARRAAGQ